MQYIAKQFLKGKEESGLTFNALRLTAKYLVFFSSLFFSSIFIFERGTPKMKSKSSAPLHETNRPFFSENVVSHVYCLTRPYTLPSVEDRWAGAVWKSIKKVSDRPTERKTNRPTQVLRSRVYY